MPPGTESPGRGLGTLLLGAATVPPGGEEPGTGAAEGVSLDSCTELTRGLVKVKAQEAPELALGAPSEGEALLR